MLRNLWPERLPSNTFVKSAASIGLIVSGALTVVKFRNLRPEGASKEGGRQKTHFAICVFCPFLGDLVHNLDIRTRLANCCSCLKDAPREMACFPLEQNNVSGHSECCARHPRRSRQRGRRGKDTFRDLCLLPFPRHSAASGEHQGPDASIFTWGPIAPALPLDTFANLSLPELSPSWC